MSHARQRRRLLRWQRCIDRWAALDPNSVVTEGFDRAWNREALRHNRRTKVTPAVRQIVHEKAQRADPEHDLCSCYCCCWTCDEEDEYPSP